MAEKRALGLKKELTPSSVFARIRPFAEDGDAGGHTDGSAEHREGLGKGLEHWDHEHITIRDNDRRELNTTKLTGVVPPEADQVQTFQELFVDSGLMLAFHSSQNVLFFAYGQTGTGKTHTMLGVKDSIGTATPSDGWGIFPRLVNGTLEAMEEMRAQGQACALMASAVEFYCGGAFDLLTSPKRAVMIDKQAQIYGQMNVPMTSPAQLAEFIDSAYNNRFTNATKMNDASSRGHTALILTLHKVSEDKQYSRTTFSLVDMAGSERSSKTGASRVGGKEAIAEVQSMFAAGTPEKLSIGAQGFMINTEHSYIMTEVGRAREAHHKGMEFRPSQSLPASQANNYFQACCDGRARLGAVITLSLSIQHGFETWFSLKYAAALMKLHAPCHTVKRVPVEKAKEGARRAIEETTASHAKLENDLKAMPRYAHVLKEQVQTAALERESATYILAMLEDLGQPR